MVRKPWVLCAEAYAEEQGKKEGEQTLEREPLGGGQVMRMGTLISGISALIEETTESEIFCHLKM